MRKRKEILIALLLTILIAFALWYKFVPKIDLPSRKSTDPKESNSINNGLTSEQENALNLSDLGKKMKTNVNSPEKETIHLKLLNALDNFKTCSGEYSINDNGRIDTYQFLIDTTSKNSFSSCSYETILCKSDDKIVFDDSTSSYMTYKVPIPDTLTKETNCIEHFLGNSERNDRYYLGFASQVICPEEIISCLYIHDNWEYTEDTYLDRAIYKIEGVVDTDISNSYSGKFVLMIDKETGIVLNFESFDESNNLKYNIKFQKINVNPYITDADFNKSTSGYKKMN